MKKVIISILSLSIVACFALACPKRVDPATIDYKKFFAGYDGCFVLYDFKRDSYYRYNEARCATRFYPCSTFKIFNSLTALETGASTGPDMVIPWDGSNRAYTNWNHDLTMQQALRVSAVWYYQELARRIGESNMQRYITAVGYGNQDIGSNLTTFWLEGPLQISANEQVEFLKRLYYNGLPFAETTMQTVRTMMILDANKQRVLSGKTGTYADNGNALGWFVGCLERKGNKYFFAINISDNNATGVKAKEIALAILKELKLY